MKNFFWLIFIALNSLAYAEHYVCGTDEDPMKYRVTVTPTHAHVTSRNNFTMEAGKMQNYYGGVICYSRGADLQLLISSPGNAILHYNRGIYPCRPV